MFGWFRKRRRPKSPAASAGKGSTGQIRTLEQELADLRSALEAQGIPPEAITRVCDQLREEIEARAKAQRQQAEEANEDSSETR